MNATAAADPQGWHKERCDLLRAVAGGSIVGMPLLYTMEMWQHGMTVPEWHLLLLLAATLVVNFGFCYLSGFRSGRSVLEAAMESVTGVGIAILYSAFILALIGELAAATSAGEIIGKVLLEAAAVSIGISFAGSQFESKSRTGGGDPDQDEQDDEEGATERRGKANDHDLSADDLQLRADLRELAAAVAGSTVFALNVAPTEEITLIAGRLSPLQLLAMLGAAAVLCYIILFAANFRERTVHVESAFQHPIAETILTCAVSLIVSAALLALLGEGSILTHPTPAAASIITLGLPAIIGGAAGRLIA